MKILVGFTLFFFVIGAAFGASFGVAGYGNAVGGEIVFGPIAGAFGFLIGNWVRKSRIQTKKASKPHAIEVASGVTRVEVVTENGREFTRYDCESVLIAKQDDGRTMKIFINSDLAKSELFGIDKQEHSE